MKGFIKFICCYILCFILVSIFWVGLEYVFEGVVHSSDIDCIIAAVLSYFITDKYL